MCDEHRSTRPHRPPPLAGSASRRGAAAAASAAPGNWWRHLVAIVAIVIALFPVVYVVSAAFNARPVADAAEPRSRASSRCTTSACSSRLQPSEQTFAAAHYVRWFVNSIIVALRTAILTVLLGALAAYAFSRFRFTGRRMGMLFLLLIQMFPQLLALVAIYLIVLRVGDVVPSPRAEHT